MKTVRRHGSESSNIEIRSRKGVLLKQQREVKQVKPPKLAEGQTIAMVRDAAGIRLSLDYNSVMVECGVEMPYAVDPGDLKAVKRAMLEVEELVNDRLEQKSAEVQKLLRSLAKRG